METKLSQQKYLNIIRQLASELKGANTQQILDRISQLLLQAIECCDCGIFLYNQEYKQLACTSYTNSKNEKLNESYLLKTVSLGDGVVGRAAKEHKSLRIANTQTCDYYNADIEANASELSVPMLFGDLLVGVIDLESQYVEHFTENHQKLVEMVSNVLAPIIISSQLVEDSLHQLDSLLRDKETIAERELLYRSIILNAGDAIIVHDISGKIFEVNNQAVMSLGYSVKELTNMTLASCGCLGAENVTRFKSLCLSLKPDESHSYQTSHRRRDGSMFPVEVNMNLLPNGQIVSVVRDISKRMNTIKELEETQGFLEKLVGTLPSTVYVYDFANERIKEGAKKVAALLGYEQYEEFKDNSLEELVHSEDKELWRKREEEVQSSTAEELVESSMRLKKADGSWAWIQNKSRIFKRNDLGEPLYEVGSLEDVSLIKYAELQLLQKEGFYRNLVENAFDGVILYDQAGEPQYATTSTLNILGFNGFPKESINGFDYVHEDSHAEVKAAWKRVLESPGIPQKVDSVKVYKHDRTIIWVDAVLTNLFHLPEMNGIVVNFRDVTAQHQVEQQIAQKNTYFKSLVENSYEGIVLYNKEHQIIYTSQATSKMLGLNSDLNSEQSVLDFIEPEDLKMVTKAWVESLSKPGETIKLEDYRLLKADGNHIWIENTLTNMLHDSNVEAVVSNFRDITEKKNSEKKLANRERYFRALVEHSFDGIVLYSVDGETIYRSKSAKKMLAIQNTEPSMIGRYNAVHENDRQDVESAWEWVQANPGQPMKLKPYRMLMASGNYIWVENTLTNLIQDADIKGIISNFRDVSYSKSAEENIYKISNYDKLTQLPNRAFFTKKLQTLFKEAIDSERPMSLLYFDISQLNSINSTLGHSFGDKVLHRVASALKSQLAESDLIARCGNDEFAVVLNNRGAYHASRVVEEVLQEFDSVVTIEQQELKVNLKAGIACFPEDAQEPVDLISKAEIAVSRVKRTNKSFDFFQKKDKDTIGYKLGLETELIQALDNNELELHYQPKVCMQTGKIGAVEALLRWKHKEKGYISPQVIISIAEESSLINKLTAWVLQKAVSQSSQWKAQGLDIQVAINLSAKNLQNTQLDFEIESTLTQFKLPANLLEVEITESAAMADIDKSIEILNKISAMGVSIALDDFGTGYSSISYLSKLPANIVKIDRSFIKDNSEMKQANDYKVVQNIIKLTESFDLIPVIEGIENKEQYLALKNYNCQIGQGFFFSKAKTAIELEPMLTDGFILH